MQTPMKILLTAGLGAVSMYYLDPSRGRHRRALAVSRIEHGKEAVTQGVHTATDGLNRASHRARVARRNMSRRTDRFLRGARDFSHDNGDRVDQVTHGARDVSQDARSRAAAAAATVGSFFDRHRPNGNPLEEMRDEMRDEPRVKFLLIPVTWIFTVGLGAAAMYYFDSSQGVFRRTRLRNRLATWRDRATEKVSAVGRDKPRQPKAGNGSADSQPQQEQSLPG